MKRKHRLVLFSILSMLILCFIFGNSLLGKEQSGAKSSLVADLLRPILDPKEKIPEDLFHHFVRKLAHFTEFAALGAALSWRLGMLEKRKFPALVYSFGTACLDETIQLFVPDRGPAIRDVVIDTCGAAVGILLLLLGEKTIGKIKTSKENKTL